MCGAMPTVPGLMWPLPIVRKIVTSFSAPVDRVVLLPWPQPPKTPPTKGTSNTARATLANALATVNGQNRVGRVLNSTDRLTGSGAADLVILSLIPGRHTRSWDRLMSTAAQSLRPGGIVVVLTHCDWGNGELVDPTGAIVTAGQNANLLYLQHIIAVHASAHRGAILPALTPPSTATSRRQRDCVLVGSPSHHRRIHSDVLVFAQALGRQSPPLEPTAVPGNGGTR
jgi:SAM-dependent methyltransferase